MLVLPLLINPLLFATEVLVKIQNILAVWTKHRKFQVPLVARILHETTMGSTL